MISNRSRQAARTGWTGLVITDASALYARGLAGTGHPVVARATEQFHAQVIGNDQAPAARMTQAFAAAGMAKNPAPPPRGSSPV